MAGEVQRIVRDDLKTVPVTSVMTRDELVDASVVPERMIATLSSVFGGLGGSLAALGLYGLLASTVTRRTKEIGIRIALGPTRADISRIMLRGALGVACAGLAIGVSLTLVSRRAARHIVTDLLADSVWSLALATAAMLTWRRTCRRVGRPGWSRSRRCASKRTLTARAAQRPPARSAS